MTLAKFHEVYRPAKLSETHVFTDELDSDARWVLHHLVDYAVIGHLSGPAVALAPRTNRGTYWSKVG